jgi:hypothetical protein
MRARCLGTVLALAGGVFLGVQCAYADAKDEFKKGCESGTPPNSFVENVDNVQCNTTSGTVITCDKAITHCTASASPPTCSPVLEHNLLRPAEITGMSCRLIARPAGANQ